MKKTIYYLGAERVFLPTRLGKLLQIYGKPVRTMLEYDPSEVDDKRGVGSLYYLSGSIEEQGFTGTLYGNRENAEKQKEINTKLAIGRVMQEKGYKIKEFDEKNEKIKDLEESVDYKNSTIRLRESKIEELEKQIEELKSLPPVNVETIHNEFDDLQDENLTESRKRGRSNWEK